MTTSPETADPFAPVPVDLKDPYFAAFLAWLIPGLGHMYQRRWGKGGLFMTCILGTFFFGLYLGSGQVVYAAWGEEPRYAYLCQLPVGLPALPALIQAVRVPEKEPLWPGIMVPPRQIPERGVDELSERHKQLNVFFELGTVYTMIAGLLNILAIYDAFAGPVFFDGRDEKDKEKGKGKDKPPPE